MRVVIENAELLIYTSRILPMDCWSEALKSFICGKALFFLLFLFFPPNHRFNLSFSKLTCRIPVKVLSVGSVQAKEAFGT